MTPNSNKQAEVDLVLRSRLTVEDLLSCLQTMLVSDEFRNLDPADIPVCPVIAGRHADDAEANVYWNARLHDNAVDSHHIVHARDLEYIHVPTRHMITAIASNAVYLTTTNHVSIQASAYCDVNHSHLLQRYIRDQRSHLHVAELQTLLLQWVSGYDDAYEAEVRITCNVFSRGSHADIRADVHRTVSIPVFASVMQRTCQHKYVAVYGTEVLTPAPDIMFAPDSMLIAPPGLSYQTTSDYARYASDTLDREDILASTTLGSMSRLMADHDRAFSNAFIRDLPTQFNCIWNEDN